MVKNEQIFIYRPTHNIIYRIVRIVHSDIYLSTYDIQIALLNLPLDEDALGVKQRLELRREALSDLQGLLNITDQPIGVN